MNTEYIYIAAIFALIGLTEWIADTFQLVIGALL